MAIDTIADLLVAIERLPAAARAEARVRVDEALARPAPAARAALGLLALDLVGDLDDLTLDRVGHLDDPEVIVVPELAVAGA